MLEQNNLDFLTYGAHTGNISLIFYTALNLINFILINNLNNFHYEQI